MCRIGIFSHRSDFWLFIMHCGTVSLLVTDVKIRRFLRRSSSHICCVYQLSADCTKHPLKRKRGVASSQPSAGLIPIITHHAYSKQQGMKDRGRVMRLLLLARDYAQSFSVDKRSEEQMWRMGLGKPSVLISYFRECTLLSNLIPSRCFCALNILSSSYRKHAQCWTVRTPATDVTSC